MKRGACIVLLVLFMFGCVSESSAEKVVTRYLKNRWNDFKDLFIFQYGLPQKHNAWGLHLRVTDLLQFGQIHFEGQKMGMEGRVLMVAGEEKDQKSLPLYMSVTEIDQSLVSATPPPEYWRGRPILRNGRYEWNDGRDMPWSLGLEFMIPPCFGGLEIGFAPCQLGDLVLGIVGFDTWDDDLPRAPDEEPVKTAEELGAQRFVLEE